MTKVWLEAAVNGPWTRSRQPAIPVSAEDIAADCIACAKAGAAILHFHPYDTATGLQVDTTEAYAEVIDRVREVNEDVILYGTLPMAGLPNVSDTMKPAERFAHVKGLAERGLIEWSVVDPGSTNITLDAWAAEGREGFTYYNPESHIRYGLGLCAEKGIHPSYAIYEPGFIRQGAALHRVYEGCPMPVYRFMFSDRLTFSFPPELYALEAYRTLCEEEHPGAPWMVAGLAVDIRPLIAPAVERGGHVRVGLEDQPFGVDTTNGALVEEAVKLIEASGGTLATPDEVRAGLV
ncbi:3-keto-5-aminohexanoate cleavage protein [Nisaea acidiphila]|uniref:3-keto-5-aminohexanoate cleavage protein n=1 Tax=Nisaea acidiphila TaxID=1862145 RepID=A0A9J7AZG5_9PROT|nr:3-keto-5-aminohexanoate cleavage protein [Nisaea acidiphila]UUX51644.1 3-keto-5-aminohexanoate cleavage protein [Nisaea acidiphila]